MNLNQCLTCRHWGGDKTKMRNLIEEDACLAMHLTKGWPEYGDCAASYQWLELQIHGDAVATIEVPANFGCVYHQEEQK